MVAIRRQPGGRFNTINTPVRMLITFFAAVQEQLGLKLEATKGPVDVWVIDSIQKSIPDKAGRTARLARAALRASPRLRRPHTFC